MRDFIQAQGQSGNTVLRLFALSEFLLKYFFISAVRFYQIILSPLMGGNCRFYPSCSEFANEALRMHGLRSAICIIVSRIFSCHPCGRSGYDPVPPTRS